jgi:hypothetical protein
MAKTLHVFLWAEEPWTPAGDVAMPDQPKAPIAVAPGSVTVLP